MRENPNIKVERWWRWEARYNPRLEWTSTYVGAEAGVWVGVLGLAFIAGALTFAILAQVAAG